MGFDKTGRTGLGDNSFDPDAPIVLDEQATAKLRAIQKRPLTQQELAQRQAEASLALDVEH